MGHVDARTARKQLTAQVVRSAHARRAVGQFARIGFAKSHQLGQGFEGLVLVDDQHVGVAQDGGQRRHVLERIKSHGLEHMGADGHGGAGGIENFQRVGCRLDHGVACHCTARAGPVFHDHGLAQLAAEHRCKHTRRGVNGSAWGITHDEFDGVAACGLGPQGQGSCCASRPQKGHQ